MSPVLRPACLALLALLLAGAAHAQAVYTWKDAKGVTHYADAPPPKAAGKAQLKAVKTSTPATAAAAPVTASTDAAAKAANAAAAASARCSQARANLAALQGAAPVGPDANGDGKPDATLGAEDRAKQATAMQAAVQRYCTGG